MHFEKNSEQVIVPQRFQAGLTWEFEEFKVEKNLLIVVVVLY